MKKKIQSYFIEVADLKLHFLISGEGPPIFLFHASPLSSRSLVPLIEHLSSDYTIVATDTPGYGLSESPGEQPSGLETYTDILHQLQLKLGFPKIAIYGTATGAQIGIRYTIRHPESVSCLFLDNTAHFAPEEQEVILEGYFPDFTPQEDGSHLPLLWDNVVHLFRYFPWCLKEEEYKLSTPDPPLAVLHSVFLDYLTCGSKYDWAYRPAFAHEVRDHIFEVTRPVHIFRWDSSIVKAYTDKIFEVAVPDHVSHEVIPASRDRYTAMYDGILQRYNDDGSDHIVNKQWLTLEEQTFQSSDTALPLFPHVEPSGAYLLKAWNRLDDVLEQSISLDKKCKIYLEWAQRPQSTD